MKPRGALMIEHRLIEKMIEIIKKENLKIKETKKINIIVIDTIIDFIKIYADKTHHGKEEDILFRDLAKKKINEIDLRIMNELFEEHKYGRKTVKELIEGKENYANGKDTLNIIIDKLNILADFYPKHIEKEDKIFFPGTEKYFTENELQLMLKEFWEFDRTMIHERYKLVIESLKKD